VTDGSFGIYVWDLESGNTYIVFQNHPANPITPGRREVPQHVRNVIAATDEDLKNQWRSTMDWDEVRETVFSIAVPGY
jgi:hypothetical protein